MVRDNDRAVQAERQEGQQEQPNIQSKISRLIASATGYVETAMGCIIMVVIVILTVRMVLDFPQNIAGFENEGFTEFLSDVLTLVVGLEFIKMLCMHTADTVIEVLMFATARQMIVEHLGAVDTLIGIITIGILFAIRKYLLIDEKPKIAQKKIRRNQEQQD